MNITKRCGKIETLTKKKIFDSICKANQSVNDDDQLTQKQIKRITDSIYSACEDAYSSAADENFIINIDFLEDMVEEKLMEANGYEVAKQYIKYRYEKERIRGFKGISEKLMAKNVENQNANIDEFSYGGRIGETASYVMKEYALNHLMSEKMRKNHMNNTIYIHDLDHYAVGDHNCLSIPFDDLLHDGFNTRQVDIRPASSVSTAMQLVAVIFQIQSLQQFGGVAATHLDWTMVPYVRKSFWKYYHEYINVLNNKNYSTEFENSKNDWIFIFNKEDAAEVSIDDSVYTKEYEEFNSDNAYKYALYKITEEINQSVEGLYHNLNSLQSRSGNQLPFTSINYGTCTLHEGRLIIESLLNNSIKGVGKFHKTAIFPCGIFQSAEGINRKLGDPNYDLFKLALKSTAIRLYPNYGNVNWTNDGCSEDTECEKQEIIDGLTDTQTTRILDALNSNKSLSYRLGIHEENGKIIPNKDDERSICSTMGCRTYNGYDINWHDSWKDALIEVSKTGDIKNKVLASPRQKDGRGNISPVTIIMPTLAMEAEKNVEKFMKLLDEKIHEAKDMLLERFDWQCSQSYKSAKFMYENQTMYGYIEQEGIKSALKHGTNVIGQLGLAETLNILIGCDHTSEEGMNLAKRIEELFNTRCKEFKKKYKINFGVYYTPAENLCHTAMDKFKAKYGIIKNVSDREYFTNSIHVPVWDKVSPFEKIDIESELTTYSNAGCITYVELDASAKNNIKALEDLVVYAMEHNIPYFAINTPSDTCLSCGYQGEINDECPECGGNNVQHLRRVTGYLTGDYKTSFNIGKIDEVEDRINHNGLEI